MQKLLKFLFQLILIVKLILSGKALEAGPLDDLVKYIAPEGSMVNTTTPKSFNNQAGGGFIGGGGVVVRGPAPKDLTPLRYQTGSFNFDPCTKSFDIRFPSVQWASSEEIKNFIKDTLVNSSMFLAESVIDSVTPQLMKNLREAQKAAQLVNNFSFNSCKAGQAIAKTAQDIWNNREQLNCSTKKLNTGNSIITNQRECGANVFNYPNSGTQEQNSENTSLLEAPYNLVWHAIMKGKSSPTKAEIEYTELLMSVVGTLIVKKDIASATKDFTTLPSLFSTEQKLATMLGDKSGKVDLYSCPKDILGNLKDKKCLAPEKKEVVLEGDNNLVKKVTKAVENLVVSLSTNDEKDLDVVTISIVENIQIPLLRLVEQEIALKGIEHSKNFVALHPEQIELICYEVVTSFVSKTIQSADEYVENISNAATDIEHVGGFVSTIRNLQKQMNNWRTNSLQKALLGLQIKEYTSQREEVTIGNLQKLFGASK